MNLFCRLGWHQWYRDGALFYSGDRCNRCERWRNRHEGENVEWERETWAEAPKSRTGALNFVAEAVTRRRMENMRNSKPQL